MADTTAVSADPVSAIANAAGSLFDMVGNVGTSVLQMITSARNNWFATQYQTEDNITGAYDDLHAANTRQGTYTMIALVLVVVMIIAVIIKRK